MSVAASQRSSKKQYKMAAKGTAISNAPENNSADQYVEYDIEEKPQVSIGSDEQTESSEQFISWSQICRVCANPNDHIIPIFEAEGAEHDLINKIHKYLPIQVSKTDTLPLQLCYHCAATILAWHELLEGCLDAENQLLQMQIEQTEKQQLEIKSGQNLNEEQIDDPEQTIMEQDEEEAMEHVDIGEEPTKRSEKPRSKTKVKIVTSKDACKIDNEVETRECSERLCSLDCEANRENTESSCTIRQNRKSVRKSIFSKALDPETIDDENETLESRLTKSRGKKRISDDPYVCNLCGKKFRLRDSLKSHLRIHTGEKHLTCHICGKQFAQSGSLYYHLRHVHGGVKNHSCDICGKSFAMKATMEDHRRSIHTGERPYVCDSCGKTFKTKSSLYIHSRIHTETYPHSCKYCQKTFRWKQQLIGHLTIHTGEKNHSCDLCGKAFGVKNHLTRHKRIHITEKPYTCSKCGASFGQKRYLTNHERTRHGQENRDERIL